MAVLLTLALNLVVAAPLDPPRAAFTVGPTVVRASSDAGGSVVGALSGHAPVSVTECWPTCDDRRGWAGLGQDGVVPLSSLGWADGGEPSFLPDSFVWGVSRNRDGGVPVHVRPLRESAVLLVESGRKTLAFRAADAGLTERGWLERPTGGFVSANDVRLLQDQSTLRGVPSPSLPLVMTFRATSMASADASIPVEKFARFALVAVLQDGGVLVDGGVLPGKAVRIAWPHDLPPGLADGGRWVHINTAEQTLTAWEGATPVFATLVSTGGNERARRTRPGLHRVWVKALHDRMRGDEYFIEEVRFIQYFARGQGLHAASWHDAFGQAVSHGCVNLSTEDARWLFEWSPPSLPQGWHTVWPLVKGTSSLWVLVEPAPRSRFAEGRSSLSEEN